MHYTRTFQVDQLVELIYIGKDGNITQRVIKIHGVTDEKVFGYCFLRKGFRSFQKDQILAIQPLRKGSDNKLA